MKLTHRVVAVAAVASLTLALPGAAYAGGKPAGKGKGTQATTQQEAKSKADKARKKAEQARKKAEERKHFAFPGTVTGVDTGTVTITRKERGVVVSRSFVVDGATEVKRDGERASLADVRVGDRAVVVGARRNGVLVVRKLKASSAAPAASPSPSPSASPAIVI